MVTTIQLNPDPIPVERVARDGRPDVRRSGRRPASASVEVDRSSILLDVGRIEIQYPKSVR